MKTPRELTSRVWPASSRLPLSRNFTEIGKSSENRRVDRLSGCGCAMAGLQIPKGPFGLILAYVAEILLDILECDHSVPRRSAIREEPIEFGEADLRAEPDR